MFESELRGTESQLRQNIIRQLNIGEKVKLEMELFHTGKFYNFAVYAQSGDKLGYLPKWRAQSMSKQLSKGTTFEARVKSIEKKQINTMMVELTLNEINAPIRTKHELILEIQEITE